MPSNNRQSQRGTQQIIESCPYESRQQSCRPLRLMKHEYLHEDGRKLITTWFKQAWDKKSDDSATFESFIFAWISINAWAACVTDEDVDSKYLRKLKADTGLSEKYQDLLRLDRQFQDDSESFIELLPIFRAKNIRRQNIKPPKAISSRRELVEYYFDAGLSDYAPDCAKYHLTKNEKIPNDWPHMIDAIYRIRCNLFHGEKAAHSEMDKQIVRAAFLTLIGFFRGTSIL